jgi:hypothetical protein
MAVTELINDREMWMMTTRAQNQQMKTADS